MKITIKKKEVQYFIIGFGIILGLAWIPDNLVMSILLLLTVVLVFWQLRGENFPKSED